MQFRKLHSTKGQRIFSQIGLILLFLFFLNLSNGNAQANCDGNCNDGLTPCFNVNLPTPNASVNLILSGSGHCCEPQIPDNQNCAQLFITFPSGTVGIEISSTANPSPCSNDLYDSSGGCGALVGPIEFCDPYCPDPATIPPAGGTFEFLICKPGNFVDVDIQVTGVPAIVITTPDVTDDGAACAPEFSVFGVPPGNPVMWSPMTYLTCLDIDCHYTTFEYTGPSVLDCGGVDLTYDISIPATSCEDAYIEQVSMTVFPSIQGSMDVVCSGSNLNMIFVPNVDCPELAYQWYDENDMAIPNETGPTLTVTEDDNTYTLQVSRAEVDACPPFSISSVASCCQVPEFISCPSDLVVTTTSAACLTVDFPTPAAISNCDPVTVTQTSGPLSGTDFPLGVPQTITFEAENANGQVTECSFTITLILDTELTLYCPFDVNICSDPGSCSWLSEGLAPITSANCGNLELTYQVSGATIIPSTSGDANGVVFNQGISFVTYTLTDPLDLTLTEVCGFTVTINDCEGPMITCPIDVIDVECGSEDVAAWANTASAVDVGGCNFVEINYFVQTTTELCGEAQIDTYIFIATDAAGNTSTCTATYGSVDSTPPSMDMPASGLELECDGNDNATDIIAWLNNNGGAVASDICSSVSWTNDYGNIDNPCVNGSVTVTFTASDACGNTTTTQADIDINDTTPPTWILQPSNLTIECDGTIDPLDQIASWVAIAGGGEADDACSFVAYSDNFMSLSDACGETGSAEVTFTAIDACGNATIATATITVVDNTAPLIELPAQNMVVECDGEGNTTELTNWLNSNGNALATDACSSTFTWANTQVVISGTCGAAQILTYAFTATDECGNTSVQTTADFIIEDTTSPTIDVQPSEQIVECDGNGNTMELFAWLSSNGGATASDDCSLTLSWGYLLVNEQDSCGNTGRNTYRFIVADECGNTSSAEADFVIRDITAPSITNSASELNIECDGSNNAAEILNWLNNRGGATATDICGTVTWSHDYGVVSGGCSTTTGSTIITFTATDDCGNTSTTSAELIINDNTPPVWSILPANLEVECNGTNDPYDQIAAWVSTVGGGVAEDSCSLVSYSNNYDFDNLVEDCSDLTGTITVDFTASDACNNTITVSADVTIADNTAPEITSPAIDTIVECDGFGNPAELAFWLGNSGNAAAADLCGDYTWNTPVLIETIEACGETETLIYSFTATDECGNTSLATIASFIIIDTTPPLFLEDPEDETVECDGAGNLTELSNWLNNNGAAVAEDICNGDEILVWEYDLISTSDDCGITEANTYRFTVWDDCGNSSTADALFIIEDTTPPSIDPGASALTIECDGSSNAAQILDWLNDNGGASATDDCGVIVWSHDYGAVTNGCSGNTGQTTITFTATDECGNSSSTSALLTINDEEAPIWEILPSNLELECDGTNDPYGEIAAWVENVGGGEAEDSCSYVSYFNDYDFANLTGGCSEFTGSILVTFTASDACSNITTAQATVTIVDNTPPEITSPAIDTIVECDGMDNPGELMSWLSNNGGAGAADVCSEITWNTPVALDTLENCGGTKVFIYSFDADDECGNTSAATIANFVIIDTTPPTIDAPPLNETVECDGAGNLTELNDWLNSNGGGVASDICNDDANLVWEYDLITTTDQCGITETNTYRFTVWDECGNSSTSDAVFIIEDTTPPLIVPIATDLTIVCDGASNAAQILDWLNDNGGAEATDDCSVIVWSHDYGNVDGGCSDNTGSTLITFTATDECGNFSTTTATLTINDEIAPFWEILPADLEIECDGTEDPYGEITAWVANIGGGEAEDSCSYVTYIDDYDFANMTGGCSEFTGTQIVTFTASDACSNMTTAQASVTIIDITPPEITSPAIDTIVECDGMDNPDELMSWLANNGNASAEDVCSEITWNTPVLVETILNCGGTKVFVYSFDADDECANTSAATIANFIIIDTTPPTFDTPPADETVECDGAGNITELDAWLMNNGSAIASDICLGNASLIWEYDLVSATDSCGVTESKTYRFTVWDDCGNSATGEAVFVIEDTTPPDIFDAADDLTVDCDGTGNEDELLDWLNNNGGANATDDCGAIVWSNDYGTITNSCGTAGAVTVVFTATDECGNFSTTEATFTIEDNTAPIWEILPADLIVECDGTEDPMGQIQAWLDIVGGAEAEDTCSFVTYMNDYDFANMTGGCSEFTGSQIVTFTATDDCDNAITSTATVSIVDTTPPDITSPAIDTLVECDGLGNLDDLTSWLANNGNATSADNCSSITWNTPVLIETIESCGGTLTHVYSFDSNDECANTSAATIANFVIQDTTPPSIDVSPMDETVECDGAGNTDQINAWLAAQGSGEASDICNDDNALVWEYDLVSTTDSCGVTESKTYRFTVSDDCGNTATSEATFIIEDTTPPTIDIVAMALSVECDGSSNAAQILDWLNNNGGAEASDDCGVIVWSNDYGSVDGGCSDNTGSTTITFTATDECGNSSATAAELMINDEEPPVWVIDPVDLLLECDGTSDPNGQISAWLNTYGGGEATDSCSLVAYSHNGFPQFTNGCSVFTGIAEVTFTATDACGNFSIRTATVIIEDTTVPAITSPAVDMTVECDGEGNEDALDIWLDNNGGATATDLCGEITWDTPVLIETIEGCGLTVTYVYSFSATDDCNNTSAATIANFIIIDTTSPAIDIPAAPFTVECNGSGNLDELNGWLEDNGGAEASDDCTTGNEEIGYDLDWTYDLVSSTPGCGITGEFLYRFTVTDDCGNSSITEAIFIIEDTTNPTITAPAIDLEVDCNGAGNVDDLLDWLNNNAGATATDDCGTIVWSNDYNGLTSACGASGGVTVIFIATDDCGNLNTTEATFSIIDDTAPIWEIAPVNLTIECDGTSDPNGQINAWLLTAGGGEAEDDCSFVTYEFNYPGLSNGCSEWTGSALVTFTAFDECDNSASLTATVSVIDSEAPYFNLMAQDSTVECDGDGNVAELQSWLDNHAGAIAFDDCSEPITWNNTLFDTEEVCGGSVIYTYSFTATDNCGNVSPQTLAEFFIEDTTPPVLTTLPSGENVECDEGGIDEVLQDWLDNNGGAEAEDICSDEITWSHELIDQIGCGGGGFSTYRFYATDACGNSSFADAIFGIGTEDGEPVLIEGEDLYVECDQEGANNDVALISWLNNNGGASANIECLDLNWSNDFNDDNWVFDCGSTKHIEVTFTASDGCGNSISTSSTFGILDSTDPVFENCPRPPIIVDAPAGWCAAYANFSPVAAEDNCGNVTITQIDDTGLSSGDLFPVGMTILIWEAIDDCGNASTCSFKVIVNDYHTPPIINCPDGLVIDNSDFICGAVLQDVAPTLISDNCINNTAVTFEIVDENGDLVICGVEDASGEVAPVGVNTITYSAQDQPIFLITEVVQGGVAASNILFFNEIHYDNTGGDTGEFFEIAGTAGMDLTGYSVALYNGSNGTVYNTINLGGIIPDDTNGFGFVDVQLPSNGLQNGSPDGLALMDPMSNVIYFLSYEGTFTATNGPANGLQSTDIGVSESGTTPVGSSLQLTGSGSTYADFSWSGPDMATAGIINTGQTMVPGNGGAPQDAIELTNFGPASLDISCLIITREGNGAEQFIVPMGTVLGVGDTYVYNFNTGLSPNDPAGYAISFEDAIFDEVATNAYQFNGGVWSGDLVGGSARRLYVCDHDDADDWQVLNACDAPSLGQLNSGIPLFTDNNTTTSLQSELASSASCSFNVTVNDVESPQCAMYVQTLFEGPAVEVEGPGCISSVIPVASNFSIGQVNLLDLDISAFDVSNLTVTLTSPAGTTIDLFNGLCEGTDDVLVTIADSASVMIQNAPCGPLGNGGIFKPFEALKTFYGEPSNGDWVLSVSVKEGEVTQLNGWTLELLDLVTFNQNDVFLVNDPGMCGADFTWTHPVFQDNCCEGTTLVEYTTDDANIKGGVINSGSTVTIFFPTGSTEVTYTLTDANGNLNSCSFTVTVVDQEFPEFENGCLPDLTISLDAGECCKFIDFADPAVNDNCEVSNVDFYPPSGTQFCIGTTTVTVTIVDASGNTIDCSYDVTILEYQVSEPFNFTCNDFVNISLDANCQAEINADMILEGSNYGCYDNYCIEITDQNGNILPDNILTSEHVGQTFTVSVSDCVEGGSSCWGEVYVFDVLEPIIECPADITVACNDPYDILTTGEVTLLSCEDNVTITYTDFFTDHGNCSDPRAEIQRTWLVVDESGNSTSCTQTILVQPFDLEVVDFPADWYYETALSCSDVDADPTLIEPENTGIPTVDGISLFGDHFCEVNIGYWDETFYDANCPGAYEILRHWGIINECLPLEDDVNPLKHIQRIKVEDFTPPYLGEIQDTLVSTDSWGCGLTFELPTPLISDNCTPDDEIEITYGVVGGVISGDILYVQSPAKGQTVYVTVWAADNCKNVSSSEFEITIEDQVAPTVVADDHTIVTLSSAGVANIYAIDLDDGSHDGCGPLGFLAKRMDNGGACLSIDNYDDILDNGLSGNGINDNAEFNEEVHFCCEDIQFDADGNQIPIMVQFMVCDDADMDGISGHGEDNCNVVMIEVEVQDKLAPVVIAPEDLTIDCIDYFALGDVSSLSDDELNILFGSAEAYTTCGGEANQITQDNFYCDEDLLPVMGIISRVFTVTTAGGTSTEIQKITIVENPNGNSFLQCDDVYFAVGSPEANQGYDWCQSASNNGPIADFGAVEVASTDCGGFTPTTPEVDIDNLCTEVGINVSIDTFAFAGGGCYKYLVHWEVIDQCKFDENFVDPVTGETNPFHNLNGYYHIYVEYDVFDTEGPKVTCETDYSISCDASILSVVTASATDNCTDAEYMGWDWKIDFDNDFTIDKEGQGSTAVGPFPVGTHRVIWIVSDGCGNITTHDCVVTITQDDNKAPTPYCYNGLSTAVMQPDACTIEINAADFDAGSFDDCSENLIITMIPEVDALDIVDPYAGSTSSWLFDCSYITNGVYEIIPIRIYVTDEAGNYDYCVADLRIDDHFDCCEDSSNASSKIAGLIETETNEPVAEVTVEAMTSHIEYPKYFETEDDGEFVFNENPFYYDYKINSEKDFDYLNGVTTLDIVLIQKHILSIQSLDSPYKLIAADINSDCNVTASDLLQLRKLILGKYTDDDLPFNTSWRFVDADFEFENPSSPCSFDEELSVDALSNDELNEDFIGVKIGDVNGSVIPNINVSAETRNSSPYYFEMEDVILKEGRTINIPVSAKNFTDVFGYQMSWFINPEYATLNTFKSGANTVSQENFGLARLDEGLVSMSWHNIHGLSVNDGDPLFYLTIEVLKEGLLSQMISIDDRVILSEIYKGVNLDIQTVDALFYTDETEATADKFELYQNEPNPFDKQTVIGFNLAKNSHVKLSFLDGTGKTLKLMEDDYEKGYHEVVLKKTEVNTSGVIYYQISTEDFTATKKMIILN